MKRFITRKISLGRFGLPVWSVAVAGLMVAAAAGQAVGPVLSGSVTGSVGMVVEQAITLDPDLGLGSNPVATGDDSATTRNDEGTEFTAAIELNVGETETVTIYVQNDSGANASALLELNVPKGIDVELNQAGDVSESQLSRNTWLLVVPSTSGTGENDGVVITIEPKDGAAPGFYTITGRIVQIEG